MKPSLIGIFDSGVGGFSIFREILKLLPNENYMYVADQVNFPYANKTQKEIRERAEKISRFLIDKGATTIVIACNTATVAAIDDVRKQFREINFVGTEPAVKPAARRARGKPFLVMATQSTLQSKRLKTLIKTYAPSNKVKLVSMPRWYELVEEGKVDGKRTEAEVERSLEASGVDSMDSVVLACTHYPLLKHLIEQKYPDLKIFDPSKAIARRVKSVSKSWNSSRGIISAYTTGNLQKFKELTSCLLPISVKVEWNDI